MAPTIFRLTPADVTLADGAVWHKVLVLHVGDEVGIYGRRRHFPAGEDTRARGVVKLAGFAGPVVEDGPGRWSVGGLTFTKGTGCSSCANNTLRTFRP